MKKGFTLIELLAVIVIVGILSILVVPVVNDMLIENKEKIAEAQKKSILKAAKNWGQANMFLLPDCDGAAECDDTITITLGQIMNEGFLDNQTIKDIDKNKTYSEATEIVIGKKGNQNTYILGENPYADEVENPKEGPTITLSGTSTIILEVDRNGDIEFKEPGFTLDGAFEYTIEVIKVSENGENLGAGETLTGFPMTKADSDDNSGYSLGFNTKKVASYKVVYTATKNGKIAKMIRTINIKDTTKPTISFIDNVEIAADYANLYSNVDTLKSNIVYISPNLSLSEATQVSNAALQNVSKVVVMDNTCGESDLTVKVETNVKSTPGWYDITYTVTDKYKNKNKKTRTIKIVGN